MKWRIEDLLDEETLCHGDGLIADLQVLFLRPLPWLSSCPRYIFGLGLLSAAWPNCHHGASGDTLPTHGLGRINTNHIVVETRTHCKALDTSLKVIASSSDNCSTLLAPSASPGPGRTHL